MKQYISFIGCLLAAAIVHATPKFEQAINLYNHKQFDQAYVAFMDIQSKCSAVWYNVGNCAYKKNEYDHALACWRCAHALAPDSFKDAIEYNIDVVEEKLNKNKEESFLTKIFMIYRSIPLILFQLIFLLSWFLLLLFIKKYNHGTKYTSLFGLLLFVTMISGIALGFKYHNINQRRGIVMKQHVSLFAGPNEQYHVLGTLDGISEVIVYEQRPPWCKVSTEHGSGWVAQDSIVVV